MPTPPSRSDRLAVLIDSDNVRAVTADALLAEIAKYGVATVKRAYGDWTNPHLKGWKEALNLHAIRPMQQFAYTSGKNSTDSAMIIDAMDLLYTGQFNGFCLVSSDSDFTGLASRLRESGVTVYGFGERKTPQALVSACDRFIYLDVLRAPEEPEAVGEPGAKQRAPSGSTKQPAASLRRDTKLVELIRSGIEASSDDEGWANLSAVGSHVSKQAADFDARNWGYAKLIDLVNAIGLFEVEREDKDIWIRVKPTKGK
jgi:uncharacterized LabA/DUF88 family protein